MPNAHMDRSSPAPSNEGAGAGGWPSIAYNGGDYYKFAANFDLENPIAGQFHLNK